MKKFQVGDRVYHIAKQRIGTLPLWYVCPKKLKVAEIKSGMLYVFDYHGVKMSTAESLLFLDAKEAWIEAMRLNSEEFPEPVAQRAAH